MANSGICVYPLISTLLFGALCFEGAPSPTVLKEAAKPGQVSHVLVELSAEGMYKPEDPADGSKAKSIPLKVKGRLDFVERVQQVDGDGRPRRSIRHVRQAANAINNDIRKIGSEIRSDVSLLVAERRQEGIVVFSTGGPLTRPELDLVQATADTLALPGLLPEKPVKEGDRWFVSDEAAKALSDYDALAANRLEAKLEELTERSARIALGGDIRGAARGGEGVISCKGSFVFDRGAGRISNLTLDRTESRKPGPVEHGLEVKSTLSVDRQAIESPPELTDTVVAGLTFDGPPAQRELLLLTSPSDKYSLVHDRDWHLVYDDDRQVVLKRLDHGEVVAQCNLAVGPNAGQGKHQDLEQFRGDIQRALGKRFLQFFAAGEVEGAPAGGFRYKVSVLGRERTLEIIWHYYLVASPDGDQLLVTFTLAKEHEKRFADQDGQLIGSLEWKAVPAPNRRK
jgi:hypothetical protein